MEMNELREKLGLELFSYHFMINNEEKNVLVDIINELIDLNIPTLYGMNEKDTRVFRKHLGIYSNGISMNKNRISKEENQAPNTINNKIRKSYILLKEHYIIKTTLFKINKYGMDKINIYDIFQNSAERYYFYHLNIDTLQDLINFGNDNLVKYFQNKTTKQKESYTRIIIMLNKLGIPFAPLVKSKTKNRGDNIGGDNYE